MTRLIISSAVLSLALLCAVVHGQNEATAETEPAKKPTPTMVKTAVVTGQGQALTVTVKSVSGSAEVREGPDKSWRVVKVKDVYQEGAQIRTGYKAKVELVFADNSQMVINRVSHFKVDKFRRSGDKVVTRSHLSYGMVRAGVEKGPAFSDYKITTSLGTLGVNGTREIFLSVDPGSGFGSICLSREGNIGWNTGSGSDSFVDPGGCTDAKGTRQDRRKHIVNNVTLVPFGSTGTEQGLGSTYGNQGSNSFRPTVQHIDGPTGGSPSTPAPAATPTPDPPSTDPPRKEQF